MRKKIVKIDQITKNCIGSSLLIIIVPDLCAHETGLECSKHVGAHVLPLADALKLSTEQIGHVYMCNFSIIKDYMHMIIPHPPSSPTKKSQQQRM